MAWLRTVLSSGTFKDKMAAMTLLIQVLILLLLCVCTGPVPSLLLIHIHAQCTCTFSHLSLYSGVTCPHIINPGFPDGNSKEEM